MSRVAPGRVHCLSNFAQAPLLTLVRPPSLSAEAAIGELMVTGRLSGSAFDVQSQLWQVPRGITKVSILGITPGSTGGGENSYDYTVYTTYAGLPGSLGYSNQVPVTPGEMLLVEVSEIKPYTSWALCRVRVSRAASGEVIFCVHANTNPLEVAQKIFRPYTAQSGPTPGYTSDAVYGDAEGGAAQYVPTANIPSGTSPYGLGPSGTLASTRGSQVSPDWPVFGGGGLVGGGITDQSRGVVRIIWGPNRTFPTNARKITP